MSHMYMYGLSADDFRDYVIEIAQRAIEKGESQTMGSIIQPGNIYNIELIATKVKLGDGQKEGITIIPEAVTHAIQDSQTAPGHGRGGRR